MTFRLAALSSDDTARLISPGVSDATFDVRAFLRAVRTADFTDLFRTWRTSSCRNRFLDETKLGTVILLKKISADCLHSKFETD